MPLARFCLCNVLIISVYSEAVLKMGYNAQRPHQGLNMKRRTPAQAFREGLPKDS